MKNNKNEVSNNLVKKYRFKKDYSFNNDIFGIGLPPLWTAKKGDICFGYIFNGEPEWIALQGEKNGIVNTEILEEFN